MKTEATLQCEFTRVDLVAPRELARKARYLAFRTHGAGRGEKNIKISLDGSLHLVHLTRSHKYKYKCPKKMPNAHSPDKEPLSLQIPRTLMGRLKLKARKLDMTLPHYIITILTNETHDITLTSKDYEAIARATREAERTGRRCATRFDAPA
jgi:hypothetical protein